jgi:hypothetical protein
MHAFKDPGVLATRQGFSVPETEEQNRPAAAAGSVVATPADGFAREGLVDKNALAAVSAIVSPDGVARGQSADSEGQVRADGAPSEGGEQDFPAMTAGKAEGSSGTTAVAALEFEQMEGTVGASGSGTDHAPQGIAMNNAAQTTKDTGLSQQNLPAHGDSLQPVSHATAATGAEAANPPRNSAAMVQLLFHALERTEDIVQLHATRLRESGTDQLHVVIKPGAGVQLSMTVRQEGDRVQAEVWMHRGDLEFFQRHWHELQQRCEARGIQLGDLQRHPDYQSQQQRQGYRPPAGDWADPLVAGAYAEFALAGSLTEPPGRRALRTARYRGWETWA